MERRVSSVKNHFNSHLGGRLLNYINQGLLKFQVLDPIIIASPNANGTYSPEVSKLRKVEIKILNFE